ncbi:MAG: hypothetical protein ACM3Z4_05140 [Hyphomicrobiales bacterium]
MRAVAEAEEVSDKHPVTPGNVVPSRELLGEMLLELGQPEQALIEFERSLERDPNRSVAFMAPPCRGSRRQCQACARVLRQAAVADRDTERPELAHAKAFLSQR